MNVENKQKLIDQINGKTHGWNSWHWSVCFVGMLRDINGNEDDMSSDLQSFLGITDNQLSDLIYMNNARMSDFFTFTLEKQKSLLIGALNSITDDNSVVDWGEIKY